MKIAIGSDHRGYDLKRRLVASLRQAGHEVLDAGPEGRESVDYPDYAFLVALAVSEGRAERGVLICGTGIGMCIAANKVHGVRAAPCHDCITAEMSRRHNDANVLCLSADLLGEDLVDRMVRLWLETEFESGRHARRVEKITRFEASGVPDCSTSGFAAGPAPKSPAGKPDLRGGAEP
jgi:ribose 5-phosphate isomerase B